MLSLATFQGAKAPLLITNIVSGAAKDSIIKILICKHLLQCGQRRRNFKLEFHAVEGKLDLLKECFSLPQFLFPPVYFKENVHVQKNLHIKFEINP